MSVVFSVAGLEVAPVQGGAAVLRGVSLQVRAGQAVGLVGSSGSGKSLTALAGIGMLPRGLIRRAGRTEAAGVDTAALRPRTLRRLLSREIGYVPQDPLASLDPLFPIGDQVTEPGRLQRHGALREVLHGCWPRANPAAAPLLRQVGIPPERAADHPHAFSGGMRQRALIAAATSLRPRLVIADEPTTALDASLERQTLDLLRRSVREQGAALLLISHDLNLVAWYCDHAYVMADGAVVEHGRTERLFRAPSHPRTRALLQEAPGQSGAAASIGAAGPPLLRLQGVSRSYRLGRRRRIAACSAIDLTVHAGEFVGLVGESGSGKSTLGRVALALKRPDAGSVWFSGQNVLSLTSEALRRLRRGFQPVFQDPLSSLNPRWRVGRSILHPLRVHGRGDWPDAATALAEVMREVELDPSHARRYPHELSGGQRQRACIARALVTRPQLLVADEALSALDVATQRSVLALLARLRRERGLAILFISHDLRTVRNVSDRIAVMQAGQLVETGPPDSVFGTPQSPYTAALLGSLVPIRFPLDTVARSLP